MKARLARDEAFLRTVVKTALQDVLEAAMSAVVGGAKGERTTARRYVRSGR